MHNSACAWHARARACISASASMRTWMQGAEGENRRRLEMRKLVSRFITSFALTQATRSYRFLVRCQLALPRAHLSLGSKSSLEDFTSVADEIVTKVHRLYSSCNPALVVQRCVRGHLGRRFFRRYRIRVMMPTVALQRWYSCREIREWKARQSVFSMVSDDENAADIRMLPLSSDTVAFENLESPSDLYFLPQDIARLKSLLRTVSKIFPKGALPNLQVSNLVLLDVGHGSISRWIPYFHVLVKREYRQRPLGKG